MTFQKNNIDAPTGQVSEPTSGSDRIVNFEVFGVGVQVDCHDDAVRQLLLPTYSAFLVETANADLAYRAATKPDGSGFQLNSYQLAEGDPVTDGEFLYNFEKDIELSLQLLRKEWYFIHGAALTYAGKTCLLIAPSGGGKSTTTWALLNNGFCYMSDELAPVDPRDMTVAAYPHALCLKATPPAPFSLPDSTLRTRRAMHVPVEALPNGYQMESTPLHAVFFVQFDPELSSPLIKPVSESEAAARIYANSLNQLAHVDHGLPAAVTIAQHVPAFEICTTRDLQLSVELMRDTLTAL
jgi:hypothetical protein